MGRLRNLRGFTLIEIMIAVGILAIVGLTTTFLVTSSMKQSKQTSASASCQEIVNSVHDSLKSLGSSTNLSRVVIDAANLAVPPDPANNSAEAFVPVAGNGWAQLPPLSFAGGNTIVMNTSQLLRNPLSAIMAVWNASADPEQYCTANTPNGVAYDPALQIVGNQYTGIESRSPQIRINIDPINTDSNTVECPIDAIDNSPARIVPLSGNAMNVANNPPGFGGTNFDIGRSNLAMRLTVTLEYDMANGQQTRCSSSETYRFEGDSFNRTPDIGVGGNNPGDPIYVSMGTHPTPGNPFAPSGAETALATYTFGGETETLSCNTISQTAFDDIIIRVQTDQNVIEGGSIILCRGVIKADFTRTGNPFPCDVVGDWEWCNNIDFSGPASADASSCAASATAADISNHQATAVSFTSGTGDAQFGAPQNLNTQYNGSTYVFQYNNLPADYAYEVQMQVFDTAGNPITDNPQGTTLLTPSVVFSVDGSRPTFSSLPVAGTNNKVTSANGNSLPGGYTWPANPALFQCAGNGAQFQGPVVVGGTITSTLLERTVYTVPTATPLPNAAHSGPCNFEVTGAGSINILTDIMDDSNSPPTYSFPGGDGTPDQGVCHVQVSPPAPNSGIITVSSAVTDLCDQVVNFSQDYQWAYIHNNPTFDMGNSGGHENVVGTPGDELFEISVNNGLEPFLKPVCGCGNTAATPEGGPGPYYCDVKDTVESCSGLPAWLSFLLNLFFPGWLNGLEEGMQRVNIYNVCQTQNISPRQEFNYCPAGQFYTNFTCMTERPNIFYQCNPTTNVNPHTGNVFENCFTADCPGHPSQAACQAAELLCDGTAPCVGSGSCYVCNNTCGAGQSADPNCAAWAAADSDHRRCNPVVGPCDQQYTCPSGSYVSAAACSADNGGCSCVSNVSDPSCYECPAPSPGNSCSPGDVGWWAGESNCTQSQRVYCDGAASVPCCNNGTGNAVCGAAGAGSCGADIPNSGGSCQSFGARYYDDEASCLSPYGSCVQDNAYGCWTECTGGSPVTTTTIPAAPILLQCDEESQTWGFASNCGSTRHFYCRGDGSVPCCYTDGGNPRGDNGDPSFCGSGVPGRFCDRQSPTVSCGALNGFDTKADCENGLIPGTDQECFPDNDIGGGCWFRCGQAVPGGSPPTTVTTTSVTTTTGPQQYEFNAQITGYGRLDLVSASLGSSLPDTNNCENTDGEGLYSTIDCGNPQDFAYDGEQVRVQAVRTSLCYTWNGWIGCDSTTGIGNDTCVVNVNGMENIRATFNTYNNGGGSIVGPGCQTTTTTTLGCPTPGARGNACAAVPPGCNACASGLSCYANSLNTPAMVCCDGARNPDSDVDDTGFCCTADLDSIPVRGLQCVGGAAAGRFYCNDPTGYLRCQNECAGGSCVD